MKNSINKLLIIVIIILVFLAIIRVVRLTVGYYKFKNFHTPITSIEFEGRSYVLDKAFTECSSPFADANMAVRNRTNESIEIDAVCQTTWLLPFGQYFLMAIHGAGAEFGGTMLQGQVFRLDIKQQTATFIHMIKPNL